MLLDNRNKIIRGIVSSHLTKDRKKIPRQRDGMFFVDIDGEKHPVPVIYTSPFYSVGNGGVLALPDPGTIVLIYYSEDGSYYYLSTIVDYPNTKEEKKVKGPKELLKDSKKVYADETGIGHRVTYTNQFDSGMKIQRTFTPNKIVSNVVVRTDTGKQILIDDSPNADCISILTEHKDGITIQAAAPTNGLNSERTIGIAAKGSIFSTSYNGSQNILVNNGGDINIINNSSDTLNPNVLTPGFRAGNVNVISQWNDVNISVRGPTGNIYLTTPLARVKIDNLGNVSVQAATTINLKAGVSINLDAPIINVNSQAQINMFSTGTVGIQGSTVGVEGPGGIFLNSGQGASPSPIAPDVQLTDNLD